MLTLTILIAAAIADLVLSSCLLAWAARRVGSRRGRFWVALAAQLVATVLVTLVLSLRLIPVQGAARVALLLGELGIQITIWFLVLRYAFAVSAKRACALLGVEFLLGVIGLAVASGVVRPFVVESFVITTPSMSPTFVPGDRIVANKLEHPHRFDLVTYRFGSPTPYTYVKRLIALPGERLRFSGGNIFINDQRVAAPPVIEGRCHAWNPWVPIASRRYEDNQTIVLGSDEYFVIADNLQGGEDSRFDGPLKARSMTGVVDLQYWPARSLRILR